MILILVLKATLILIGAAGAAALLNRRTSAAQRHLVWMLGLTATLILPWIPALRLSPTASLTQFVVASTAADSTGATSLPWLRWIWGAGAAFVLLRILVGHLRMSRVTDVQMAMTWGILRPRLLAPSDGLHRFDQQHEEAHMARRDGLWQLIAQLACAAYWFHPLVWWAERRAALERERACDDVVLSAGAAPAEYAQRLVDVARQSTALPAVALGFSSQSQLATRVEAIMDSGARRQVVRLRDFACGIALVALLLVPLAPAVVAQSNEQSGENTGVTHPRIIYKIEPVYSDEARAAGIEGAVHLKAVVKSDGTLADIEVVTGLGYGLDEKAMEAIAEWRAEPARKNGSPVDAAARITVNFRLR